MIVEIKISCNNIATLRNIVDDAIKIFNGYNNEVSVHLDITIRKE